MIINNRDLNEIFELVSRINVQVSLIKQGKTVTSITKENRLDVIVKSSDKVMMLLSKKG